MFILLFFNFLLLKVLLPAVNFQVKDTGTGAQIFTAAQLFTFPNARISKAKLQNVNILVSICRMSFLESPLSSKIPNIGVTFLCKWSFVSHRTL